MRFNLDLVSRIPQIAKQAIMASICLAFFYTSVGAEEIILLSSKSEWKNQYVYIPPKVSVKAAKEAGKPVDAESREKLLAKGNKFLTGFQTILLPENWQSIEFDDSDWHKGYGSHISRHPRVRNKNPKFLRGTDSFVKEIGLIAQRGKFIVKDPSKVTKVTLDMTYRGGAVVYLNGKQIAVKSLPEGKINFDTPGDDYPIDAFAYKNAKGKWAALTWRRQAKKEFSANWTMRERDSGIIEIDPKLLVKGLNVLSLELHRSDCPIECSKKKIGMGFSPVGIGALSFKVETSADNVVSACIKPAGYRIWSANTWATMTQKSVGNPVEVLKTIEIVGTKNGSFAAQIMISSPTAIEGLNLKASSLKSSGAEIKSDEINFKYGALNSFYRKSIRFDLLLDSPEEKPGKIMPVWVFVKVSKDTPAGVFKGAVEISVKGQETKSIPLELTVSDWTLPDVKDYTPINMIYQSTDSLSRHYNVPMWSEKHWALIEKSLKLMGEYGNTGLILPLLAESCMGNPASMITWLKQADGTYKYDFSAFDRYIKIAMKYHSLDRLKSITLGVWGYENAWNKKNKTVFGSKITVKDVNGKKTTVKLPECGTPECEAMWKPLLLEVQARLKKYKLDTIIMYGLGGDKMPNTKQAAMFNRILPGTPWFRESHFPLKALRIDENDKSKKVGVGFTSMVWGEHIPDPTKKRFYGWDYNPKNIMANFKRQLDTYNPVWDYRKWMEGTITCGRNGNSRIGGDFYNMGISLSSILSKEGYNKLGFDDKRAQGTLFNTYPNSNVAQTALAESVPDLFGAGKDGPVTTVRYENARLGNQEAEARVEIEKAIIGKKLTPELEKRCQEHLDIRTNALRLGSRYLASTGWRASNKKLFDLAGEVQKEISK